MNTIAERSAIAGALLKLRAELIAMQVREFRELLIKQFR